MNRSIKLGGIVIVMLVVIAVTHTLTDSTIDDLAPAKKTPPPVVEEHGTCKKGTVQLPGPMGPQDAAVKVKVYVTSDNECDTSTLNSMQDLAKKYGDRIYVTFGDLLDSSTLQEAQMAKIGCKSGLTINGKSKFVLPERGLKGAILLDGPTGQTNYNMKDVEDIVVHLLRKKGVLKEGEEVGGQQGKGEEEAGTDKQAQPSEQRTHTPTEHDHAH